MSEPTSTPEQPRPRRHQEYEDPHYHDEEPEIVNDEQPTRPTPTEARRKVLRKLNTRKRFED